MHAWIRAGGALGIGAAPAWWLRLPSALATMASAAALVVLVTRFFGRPVGLLAGLLFAVHPMVVFYAQDARPYALVTLTFLLSTLALAHALERPSGLRLAAYAVLAALTVYLQLFAIFALLAHGYLVGRRSQRRAPWLIAASGVLVAVAPLVWLAHRQSAEIGWIPGPTVSGVAGVLTHLAGGIGFLLAALAVAVAARVVRSRSRVSQNSQFLLLWALLPPATLVLVDFVTPDLVARYALVAVPAEVALLALAAVRSRSRVVTGLISVAAGAALIATAVQSSRPYKYENYRQAADTVGDLAHPGDAVVFLPVSAREGFDAYSHLEPDLRRVHDVTLEAGSTPAATDDIGGIDVPASQIAGAVAGSATVFVFGDTVPTARHLLHDPQSVAILRALSGYQPVGRYRYGELTVTVLRRA